MGMAFSGGNDFSSYNSEEEYAFNKFSLYIKTLDNMYLIFRAGFDISFSVLFSLNFLSQETIRDDKMVQFIRGDFITKFDSKFIVSLNNIYFKEFIKSHWQLLVSSNNQYQIKYKSSLTPFYIGSSGELIYISINGKKYLLCDFPALLNQQVEESVLSNTIDIHNRVVLSDDYNKRFGYSNAPSFVCSIKTDSQYTPSYVVFYQEDYRYFIYRSKKFSLYDYIDVSAYPEMLIQQTDDDRELEEIKFLQSLIENNKFYLETEPAVRFFTYRFKKIYDKGLSYE